MHGFLLGTVIGVLALIFISLWAIFYQLIKQQGRILLRLDGIERRLAGGNPGDVGVQLEGAQSDPVALAVGTAFAPFRFPDLKGQMVSLEEFHGKQVLLVHWSPQCGFCDLIAPQLAELQPAIRDHNVELLLVSYDDARSNRELAGEYGLECPILLLDQSQSVDSFRELGTPVAYLLDEQGKVSRRLAVGSGEVMDLAREAATGKSRERRRGSFRPLATTHIERGGLKAGTPAPGFQLPDISGGMVSLDDFRGRRVLLIFSDPNCGPCDQLAPDLVRLYRQRADNSLALVMVGRGDVDENRCKAEKFGFNFPVAVQQKWKLSREYAMFDAPVAFLIDEEGIVARNVATGAAEVLALAQEVLTVRKEKMNAPLV